MTGDENNGNMDARVDQFPLKIQTADSGKPHIEDQATWPVRPLAAQELLRGAEGLGTQADRLQHALDGGAHQSSSSTTNTVGAAAGVVIHAPRSSLRAFCAGAGPASFSLSLSVPNKTLS